MVAERRAADSAEIAVPAEGAQAVADQMIAGGVQAILNDAPVVLKAPPHVGAGDRPDRGDAVDDALP